MALDADLRTISDFTHVGLRGGYERQVERGCHGPDDRLVLRVHFERGFRMATEGEVDGRVTGADPRSERESNVTLSAGASSCRFRAAPSGWWRCARTLYRGEGGLLGRRRTSWRICGAKRCSPEPPTDIPQLG